MAAQKFAGRLAVSFQNLDLTEPANAYPIQAAETYGTAIGYQTNDYNNLEQAACSGGSLNRSACTAATYLQLLQVGIDPLGMANPLRAQYIEVLPPDAIAFPSAIAQAHLELVPPAISLVANAEGENPTIAPNTWIEIKGVSLAPPGDSRVWQAADFANGEMPTMLDGVSVALNGEPAYLCYISPTQLNVLTPPDLAVSPVAVQVTNSGIVTGRFTAQSQALSPSWFVFNGGPYVVAVHLTGNLIGPPTLYPGSTTPARPGETVALYANGFGPVSTPVVKGSRMQSGTLSPLPMVTIGGVTASVQFAGLVAPGEFQFNLTVPTSLADGDQPIVGTYMGLSTQAGTLITVQH